MSIYEAVRAGVKLPEAAERYGLLPGKNSMVCCPFHDDRTPSMKLNSDYYYCFGCGAKGDVIALTAELLGLSAADAAQKLAVDFGIGKEKTSVTAKLNYYKERQIRRERCVRVLCDYARILRRWMTEYAPKKSESELHPRFVEACRMLEAVEHMAELLDTGTKEERDGVVDDLYCNNRIEHLEKYIKELKEESDESK